MEMFRAIGKVIFLTFYLDGTLCNTLCFNVLSLTAKMHKGYHQGSQRTFSKSLQSDDKTLWFE